MQVHELGVWHLGGAQLMLLLLEHGLHGLQLCLAGLQLPTQVCSQPVLLGTGCSDTLLQLPHGLLLLPVGAHSRPFCCCHLQRR